MVKVTATARLKQLSICPCRDTVLNEGIGVGTEYTVYPESISGGFTYRCGACGAVQENVTCILADNRCDKTQPPMPLPLELFEFDSA